MVPPSPPAGGNEAEAASDEESISSSVEADGVETARSYHDTYKDAFCKMVPEVLAAFLSGKSWECSMDEFFHLNAPRFKNFQRGQEYDHPMKGVHDKYQQMVAEILQKRADEWPCRLDEAFFSRAGIGEELQKQVSKLADFEDFGEMMRARYEAAVAAPMPPCSSKYVRILWDIENVKPKGPPQEAAVALRSFLCSQGIGGDKVDLVTVAFVPHSMASEQYVKLLDRANVVMIVCTNKREDADEKLKDWVNRDIRVLGPSSTTFVFVSSDTGFASTMQNVRVWGYRVVSVHEYEHYCSAKLSLEQHADQAFTWPQVLSSSKNKTSTTPSTVNPYRKDQIPTGTQLVGHVVEWKGEKGYGFIRAAFEDGKLTLFSHATSLPPVPGKRFLKQGEIVRFTFAPGPEGKKPNALCVQAATGQLACEGEAHGPHGLASSAAAQEQGPP